MNNTETYNGFTNRATWMVSLHINNDMGLLDTFQGYEDAYELKEAVTDFIYGQAADESFHTDMLSVGLENVNWDEAMEAIQE